MIVAVAGGRLPGAVGGRAAAVAFDFFYTHPYLRFTIDSRDDVETTVLLLVVGLDGRERRHATVARARRREDMRSGEIRRIYRLATLGARGRAPTDVIDAGRAELVALLDLRACRFDAAPFVGDYERLERSGVVSWRDYRLQADGFELPAAGVELLVMGRGRLLGRFVLDPTPGTGVSLEQRVVAVALADQVGAVLAAPAAERIDRLTSRQSGSAGRRGARADVLVEPAVHRRGRRHASTMRSSAAFVDTHFGRAELCAPRDSPSSGGARCGDGPSPNRAARTSARRAGATSKRCLRYRRDRLLHRRARTRVGDRGAPAVELVGREHVVAGSPAYSPSAPSIT